jgi:hypothetical protein
MNLVRRRCRAALNMGLGGSSALPEKGRASWKGRGDSRGTSFFLGLLCAALALLGASGCAGYKLGPTGEAPAGNRSVQVNPVQNSTMEPRLSTAVNHALRKTIQRDGTFRLDTHGQGDVVINVEIFHYQRRGIAFESRDTLTATDYALTMDARVAAIERRSGRELLKKELKGRTTIRIGGDLASVERQALPLLAEDLAQKITDLLADGEW